MTSQKTPMTTLDAFHAITFAATEWEDISAEMHDWFHLGDQTLAGTCTQLEAYFAFEEWLEAGDEDTSAVDISILSILLVAHWYHQTHACSTPTGATL